MCLQDVIFQVFAVRLSLHYFPVYQRLSVDIMEMVRIAISKNHFYTKRVGYEITTMFDVMDLSYQQIGEYIGKGHTITNIFDDGGRFHRKKIYFVTADFFALDFDNKDEHINTGRHSYFSLEELLSGYTERARFILDNAFLIYTTISHNNNKNKFRALFHLPKQVKTVEEYEYTTKAFHLKFPEADTNCIEAARYFYGSGKHGIVKLLENKLNQEIIDSVIQETQITQNKENRSSTYPMIQESKDFESYTNSIIENEKLKLINATDGDRNSTLNSVCYVISSTVSEMQKQGLKPDVIELESYIKNTARELGLEPDEIGRTFESGWNSGKYIKLNKDNQNEDKPKRTHANKPIKGNTQIYKEILDHFPEPSKVKKELKENVIKTQVGVFNTFKINFQSTITEQIIDKFLHEIGSMKFLLCYFSLWKYAHKLGGTSFVNINLNDIISYSSNRKLSPKDLYKERERNIEILKTLGLISILRERKSKDDNITSDYNIVHLINDLTITSDKGKTYISCNLPKKQRNIGAYIPDKIFNISRKDEGSFFLAVALMKEINRICISKKTRSGKYGHPEFENKPITWIRKKIIQKSRLTKTDKLNKTEANNSLEKKFQKLKDLGIIKSFSEIPLDDNEKVTIVIPNPEKVSL